MTTTLSRFTLRSADQCRPFFQLLHKWKDLFWYKKCDQAFEKLKDYLANQLVLSQPEKEEVLYERVQKPVSLVLIFVDEGVQKPTYYVSKSFLEVETWYLPLEKVILP